MTFELWSLPSGNVIGEFRSEREAFAAVQVAAQRNGADYVESLSLVVEDDHGDTRLVAEGRDLFRRAAGPRAIA